MVVIFAAWRLMPKSAKVRPTFANSPGVSRATIKVRFALGRQEVNFGFDKVLGLFGVRRVLILSDDRLLIRGNVLSHSTWRPSSIALPC